MPLPDHACRIPANYTMRLSSLGYDSLSGSEAPRSGLRLRLSAPRHAYALVYLVRDRALARGHRWSIGLARSAIPAFPFPPGGKDRVLDDRWPWMPAGMALGAGVAYCGT
jgi:hypothetical protein